MRMAMIANKSVLQCICDACRPCMPLDSMLTNPSFSLNLTDSFHLKLAWVPIDLQTLELCVGNDDDSNNYISHENYTKNFVLLKVPSLLLFCQGDAFTQ